MVELQEPSIFKVLTKNNQINHPTPQETNKQTNKNTKTNRLKSKTRNHTKQTNQTKHQTKTKLLFYTQTEDIGTLLSSA